MTGSQVNIIVVPRECFCRAETSLQSIYENTQYPFSLIYVDGNSPRGIRRWLEREAADKGFKLVRFDRYLAPNEARNIGLQHADAKYVVFVDNDVLVAPGWLENLVACAEETDAWVVAPLYLEGSWEDPRVHMAGGWWRITEENGKRIFVEEHSSYERRVDDPEVPRSRIQCDLIEFHTVLVRRDVFQKIGPLDERLKSVLEHVDFCMSVVEAGGTIYLEPKSRIMFRKPPRVTLSDLPYFLLRWSDAWGEESMKAFGEKRKVEVGYYQVEWWREYRRLSLLPILWRLERLAGRRAEPLERKLIFPIEEKLNRFLFS
jgi:GT2 family glycosyltransferase